MRKGFAAIAYAIVGTLAALFRGGHLLNLIETKPSSPEQSEAKLEPVAALPPPAASDFDLTPVSYRLIEPAPIAIVDVRSKPLGIVLAEQTSSSSDLEKKNNHALKQALDNAKLDGVQRLSVRAYVGHEKDEITEFNANNSSVLIFRDPQTHAYKGEATIRALPDGTAQVNKIAGGGFAGKAEAKVPLWPGEKEAANNVLEGKNSIEGFKKNWGKEKPVEGQKEGGGPSFEVPLVKLEAGATYGEVSQATATFDKKGSGSESGYTTDLGGASAGGGAGVGGLKDGGFSAGAGAHALKVEYFHNHFTEPRPNEEGGFTQSVLGGSAELHVTLAEFAAKAGCFGEKGCGVGATAGFFGLAAGVGLNVVPKLNVPVEPQDEIADAGLASTPAQKTEAAQEEQQSVQPADYEPDDVEDATPETPETPEATPNETPQDEVAEADSDDDGIADQEEQAYQEAAKDGSPEALNKFLNDYTGSAYEDDVKERIADSATPNDDSTPDVEPTIY